MDVIYKHYKKKEGNYVVVDMCKLQHTDDNWYDAVIYKELSSGLKFCRFENEFNNKFSTKKETNNPTVKFEFSQQEARRLMNCLMRTSAKGEDLDMGVFVEERLWEFLEPLEN